MKSIFAHIRQIVLNKLEQPRKSYEHRVYNNMHKLYAVIKPGDVLLVEGRSEMSRIVKLLTNSHWSHSASYVGNALIRSDRIDRDVYLKKYGDGADYMLIEAFSGEGVVASPLKKYKDHNIRLCRPYGITEPDVNQVLEQLISKLGMHYDDQNIIAIAMMALHSVWRPRSSQTIRACLGNCNDYEVICSGMIAQAFQSVGYPIVPDLGPRASGDGFSGENPYGGGLIMRHYTQITPKDYDLSPNFEIVKFNIIGTSNFDYKSLWVDKI